ncbi:U32 family peptidase [Microaerobacter geothermalis]|uniref:peptidase U32 family protein n=1 Tax=Microaerobacter geothermalis TaxID=674972 RepID=UPI001F320AB0|nr:U32 family peptidase [Microaerobacter geothermalis]MCF6093999.1 U32 family peptidase [Microaerobacter geothermalis]
MLKTKIKKPELLAPAGNLEKLEFAIRYGADAVYIGGQQFGLRAKAGNFTFDDMRKGVQFAHKRGAKVFVAANIIAHNEDLNGLEEYLKNLEDIGIDAIIVADPAIIATAKRVTPDMEIHLSTQASTTNWQAVKFWKDEGVARVVLAREVSMEEIREIKRHVDVEIEAFIHGAMCISYSGRCVLSNHMTARDANRGGCAQSCRWKYDLFEELPEEEIPSQDTTKEIPLFTEGEEQYTMSSKDLCMIENIPDMIEAGVDSLKIEGRMKSVHYVATVVNAYRHAIDAYCEDPEKYQLKQEWLNEILKAAHRPLTSAFYYGNPTHEDQIFGTGPRMKKYDFAALVLGYDPDTGIATIQQRNHFQIGQEVEFFGPNTHFEQTIDSMWDEEGNELEVARHPLQVVKVKVKQPVASYDMMRKENT